MFFYETQPKRIEENDPSVPAEVIQLSAEHTGFFFFFFF